MRGRDLVLGVVLLNGSGSWHGVSWMCSAGVLNSNDSTHTRLAAGSRDPRVTLSCPLARHALLVLRLFSICATTAYLPNASNSTSNTSDSFGLMLVTAWRASCVSTSSQTHNTSACYMTYRPGKPRSP